MRVVHERVAHRPCPEGRSTRLADHDKTRAGRGADELLCRLSVHDADLHADLGIALAGRSHLFLDQMLRVLLGCHQMVTQCRQCP